MSLLETAQLAQHLGFKERVCMAMLKTAVAIAAEEAAEEAVGQRRQALATAVLNDPYGHTLRFTYAVLTNNTVAGAGLTASDGDLEFVVSSVWNAIAGR